VQEGVVEHGDLPDGDIFGGALVGAEEAQLLSGERLGTRAGRRQCGLRSKIASTLSCS
jgi:hypothetical protein